MRRTVLMRHSGPYKVVSASNGTLVITPQWPQFAPWTMEEGGGPGPFSRMGLAQDIESYLNAIYPTGTAPEREEPTTP